MGAACYARTGLLVIIAASSTGCVHTAAAGAPAPPPSPASAAATSASAAAASASEPASPSPASSATGLLTCPASQLTIRLIYGGPAAGTIGGVIGFANNGNTPATLLAGRR